MSEENGTAADKQNVCSLHTVSESINTADHLDEKMNDSSLNMNEEEKGLAEAEGIRIEHENYIDTEHYYGIRTTPPPIVTLMAALQHILLSMSGCLTTSQVVADVACAPYDHPVRSQLFCTTMFMVGLCTLMQTAFGVRLPIFQGPSSSFLVPLLALQRDPMWACPATESSHHHAVSHHHLNGTVIPRNMSSVQENSLVSDGGMAWRLQTMSGSLIVAAMSEVLLGGLGLLKPLLRFVGPITVACTISLIAVSIAKIPLIYGRPSFSITAGTTILVVIFILYCKNITLPLPRFGEKAKNKPRKRFPIFQLIPILLALIIMWLFSGILTVTNVFTDDKDQPAYMARTDAKLPVISSSPWFQFTYPGQFGPPSVSAALVIGFLVAFLTSTIESVGDYYAAQKACLISSPPDHAVSRGILVEGLGSVLSGAVGAGHATTSFSANIALLTVSKTTSRSVMYTASALLICVSLIGKIGASLTTIPNPVLGGVQVVLVGTLFSIGIENLGSVDMTSSRNMVVMGLPFMCAIIIPGCLDMYPDVINTGISDLDQVLKVILGMPMFLGGSLALFLDNTVHGTLESRGMAQSRGVSEKEKNDYELDTPLLETDDSDVYTWAVYPRLVKACPFLAKLPFMPKLPNRRFCIQ